MSALPLKSDIVSGRRPCPLSAIADIDGYVTLVLYILAPVLPKLGRVLSRNVLLHAERSACSQRRIHSTAVWETDSVFVGRDCPDWRRRTITTQFVRVDELAEKVAAQPAALFRMMRLLASPGVFEQTPGRRFALTPGRFASKPGGCKALRRITI
jgi:hypothetical protein